jgi:hypothetical protein
VDYFLDDINVVLGENRSDSENSVQRLEEEKVIE